MQLGLALSGGGFRATLFHLGVVKALLDRGLLQNVRHITSVSGGSILAAHLVQHWRDYTRPETFEKPARQIIELARSDVRGRIFRRLALPHNLLLPYAKHLRQWPPRLRRDGTVRNLLFERHLRDLYGDVLLSDLAGDNPDAPRLDILTTNLTQGSLAYFSNGVLVANDDDPKEVETPITAARAVMASALFPAVFPTVEFNADALRVSSVQFPTSQYFTDGGVYDNLGIRRFRSLLAKDDSAIDKVLVSDASGAFDWLIGSETLGQWKTALRSSEVFMKRLADLECEIAGGRDSKQFTFLRISDVIGDAPLPETVQQQIKHIRTDLDRFSIPEIRSLVVHGYEVTAHHTSKLVDAPVGKNSATRVPVAKNPSTPAGTPFVPWDPFPTAKQEPEQRLIDRLRRSRFHSWGLFNQVDWSSYVYPALLVIALVLAIDWYRGESLHRFYKNELELNGDVPTVPAPDVARATSLVERAVKRPHRDPSRRLETALLAYSLHLRDQGALSKELFESATGNLDPYPSHRNQFHHAKWRHYYTRLPQASFGYPKYPDAGAALAFAKDAVDNLPSNPSVQFEAALLSYGVYSTDKSDVVRRQALELLGKALSRVDPKNRALSDVYQFRATLLKGHYLLTRGAAASGTADQFMADSMSAQAREKYKEAEQNFIDAAATYQTARELHFTELWKVHQNLCNATLNRAVAAIGYGKSKEPMTDEERKQLQAVIDGNLGVAAMNCREAVKVLPPDTNKWQPTFALATVSLKQRKLGDAARGFLAGHAIAVRASETGLYTEWLKTETEAKDLCKDAAFSSVFVDTCR
jgi:predicted acylesterase/phospholipase RssA